MWYTLKLKIGPEHPHFSAVSTVVKYAALRYMQSCNNQLHITDRVLHMIRSICGLAPIWTDNERFNDSEKRLEI